MKYIYGPVISRRLRLSLGVSLTPYKVCDFDCIYCQLGRTPEPTRQRQEYVKTEEVIEELKSWLLNNKEEAQKLSYITISGLGEPTLNIKLGEIIDEIKKLVRLPVAVITNASLLFEPGVRLDLLRADLVVPSLDAAVQDVFMRIDRPFKDIRIEKIIDGLVTFRKEFKGKTWLEVMLVKGVNDDLRYIKRLKQAINRICPDKVQLNAPVRATAEPSVFAVDRPKLNKIKEILGENCEII